MDVKIIKKVDGRVDRTTGMIITERLRVTSYSRVSTGDPEQINSYESQKKYYKEKITKNNNWQYVEMYADEAITGTLDYKRTDFMRMIQDAMNGKFDMIITKSISRFARNTVDTLKYVRMLKEHNVAVLFEEENINTLEMSGELLLTILSSVAQQESETISAHVKLGLKMKKERGELVGFNNCYGFIYDSKNNKMIVKEDEMNIVRLIFKLYLEGTGTDTIAKKISAMGIKSPRGKDDWRSTTIRGILRNEKYKGDVLQGKTFTQDPISHKRLKNYGEEDKYYISNHHEQIISDEDFDRVQEILKEKCGARATGRRLGGIGRKYPMSNRLKCAYCGNTLVRRSLYSNRRQTNPAWYCVQAIKYGKYNCPNCRQLREDLIENAFMDAYQLLSNNNSLVIENFLKVVKNSIRDNTPKEKIEKLTAKKNELEQRISKLIDLAVDGGLDNESFKSKRQSYLDKIEKCENEIEQLQLLTEQDDDIEKGINKIRSIISNKGSIEVDKFDKEIFDALVDYVIIGGYDENGQNQPYMIRYICKRNFNFTLNKDLDVQRILKNNTIGKIDTNDYITILDFISNQNFISFEKDELGRLNKNLVKNIRVRVEIEG